MSVTHPQGLQLVCAVEKWYGSYDNHSVGIVLVVDFLLQRGIIEVGDDMYVMEPADENNDFSHVAYKMKRKPMKFEDGDGKLALVTCIK